MDAGGVFMTNDKIDPVVDRVDEIAKDIDAMGERELRNYCRSIEMIGKAQAETIKRQRDEIDMLKRDEGEVWHKFYDLQDKQYSAVKSLDEACEMLGIFMLDGHTISDKASLVLQCIRSGYREDDDAGGMMTTAIIATCACACLFFILVGISIIVTAVA